MAAEVIMPKVDMDQENGTIIRWLKNDGDQVRQGEIILEIETDKVAVEVEAPASGILSGIKVGAGATVPIATTIAYIMEPGEALPDDAGPAETAETAAPPLLNVQQAQREVPVTPVARNMAKASGIDPSTLSGSGRDGKVIKRDVQAALVTPGSLDNGRRKVNATPAAKRSAAQRGISLAAITGSGPDGRIQVADVLAAAATQAEAGAAAQPSAGTAPRVVPVQGMRRTIAERLTASYQSVPHIHFSARIDMTRFSEVRAKLNKRAEQDGGVRISTTALLVMIVARTLARHPWLNSTFKEAHGQHAAEIHLFDEVNMGVAVALDDGLIVPVVRDAANKGAAQIAAEVKDLVARAREGTLSPSDVHDGTFTISNLGPFGIEQFTAIINPPQAAILAVGATGPEAVVGEEGQVEVRSIMRITLAADHRVVDGARAAHFIADLKAALEEPFLLLL